MDPSTIGSATDMTQSGPHANSNRRVLSDVSPNVKSVSPTVAGLLQKRVMAGSPLKRSFTASIEKGEGLKYFKKRKLLEEGLLSLEDRQLEQREARPSLPVLDEAMTAPTLQHIEAELSSVPGVREPSPTEPNTPTDDGQEPENSSTEKKSFCSLINYDPSSQASDLVFTTTSRAEILRLRLRVAMYKVRTNQIEVPFAELRIKARFGALSVSDAVEEAVALLRHEARQAQQTSAPGQLQIPKLLPAPVLRPTEYSSRMIYNSHFPSSPPANDSPKSSSVARGTATPERQSGRLSSPPSGAEVLRNIVDQELTSSAVKGRLVEGLLGLQNAA